MAEYLKLPEVARRLDVSEKTARRLVRSGKLPAVFVGGAYRVSEEDLTEYLKSARVEPGKARRRSPFEPSFNDVLAEERRGAGSLDPYEARTRAVPERRTLDVREHGLERGWIDVEALMQLAERYGIPENEIEELIAS